MELQSCCTLATSFSYAPELGIVAAAEPGGRSVHAAVLSLPAEAPPVKRYMLKHPKHERCKAHYSRKIKQAKVHGKSARDVWCVHIAG